MRKWNFCLLVFIIFSMAIFASQALLNDYLGQYSFTQQEGTIDTQLGTCDLVDVTAGTSDILHGTPYDGDLELNGQVVGTIEWQFGGSQPLNEGSYTLTGYSPYEFDVEEGNESGGIASLLSAIGFYKPQKPHEFVDKLPIQKR